MVGQRYQRYVSPIPESGTPHRCMSRTCGGRIRDHATTHGDVQSISGYTVTTTFLQCTDCGGITQRWLYDPVADVFAQY